MMSGDSQVPRNRWTALIWKLFAACSLLLILCLVELQVILALHHSARAGQRATSAVNCVNTVLGTRNGPNAKDQEASAMFADAERVFAAASKAWAHSLHVVLGQQRGSQMQATAYGQFVKESRRYDAASTAFEAASNRYHAQLATDQSERARHPLGRCGT